MRWGGSAALCAGGERLSEARDCAFGPTELAPDLGRRGAAQGGFSCYGFFRRARDGSEPGIPARDESPPFGSAQGLRRFGARERAKIPLQVRTIPDELADLLVGYSERYPSAHQFVGEIGGGQKTLGGGRLHPFSIDFERGHHARDQLQSFEHALDALK